MGNKKTEGFKNTTITLNKTTRNKLMLLKAFFKLNNFDEVILKLIKEAEIEFKIVSEGFIKPEKTNKKERRWKNKPIITKSVIAVKKK